MATTTVPTARHFYSTAYPSGQHGQGCSGFSPGNFAWRENSFIYTERILPILPTRTASNGAEGHHRSSTGSVTFTCGLKFCAEIE
jgi:hypothetical protein